MITETSNLAPAEALPEGYYLDNFIALVTQVVARYDDLLSAQELTFCERFFELSVAAQRLLVRLLTRKGRLFRIDKLHYTEIQPLDDALVALESAGFVQTIHHPWPLRDWLSLYNKAEWLDVLANQKIDKAVLSALKKGKRAELDRFLLDRLPEQHSPITPLVDLLHEPVFDVLKLLYFGNPAQDMTEFVLRDLQLVRYEPYSLDRKYRRFASREHIERHLALHAWQQAVHESPLDSNEKIEALLTALPDDIDNDSRFSSRRHRGLYTLARQLERLGYFEQALHWYQQCSIESARERSVRVLAKLDRHTEALSLCEQILGADCSDDGREFAQSFAHRLAKKRRVDVELYPAPVPYCPPEKTITLAASDLRVELAVAQALSESGECFYVENTLFTGMFGLIYWEVIFAPVAGAFSHPFQYRPHDLYEPSFTRLRRELLMQCDAQMAESRDGFWSPETVLQRFNDKFGTANRYVTWVALSEALLTKALQRVPAAHWRMIFKRLLMDTRYHASGFPDLILFPPEGGYRLIEVKAPGDRLQTHQRRWMDYFDQCQIPHEVINVEWC